MDNTDLEIDEIIKPDDGFIKRHINKVLIFVFFLLFFSVGLHFGSTAITNIVLPKDPRYFRSILMKISLYTASVAGVLYIAIRLVSIINSFRK